MQALLQAGSFNVRAISRDAAKPVALSLQQAGAQIVEADLNDVASLEKAWLLLLLSLHKTYGHQLVMLHATASLPVQTCTLQMLIQVLALASCACHQHRMTLNLDAYRTCCPYMSIVCPLDLQHSHVQAVTGAYGLFLVTQASMAEADTEYVQGKNAIAAAQKVHPMLKMGMAMHAIMV